MIKLCQYCSRPYYTDNDNAPNVCEICQMFLKGDKALSQLVISRPNGKREKRPGA